MDHHCPWINNCVGERNQKYFLQFLFYVGVLAVYSVILVVVSWYMEGLDGLEGKMKGGGGEGFKICQHPFKGGVLKCRWLQT